MLASNPKAREMYRKLRNLRKSVDAIKEHEADILEVEPKEPPKQRVDSAGMTESEKAVLRKAREDSELSQRKKLEMAKKQAQRIKQMEEAKRNAAIKQREAKLLRQKAIEAGKEAEKVKASKAGSADEIIAAQAKGKGSHNPNANGLSQQGVTGNKPNRGTVSTGELENLQDVLKDIHAKQGKVLNKVSDITDTATSVLNEKHEKSIQELTKVQEEAKIAREKQREALADELEESRAKRKQQSEQNKAKHISMEAEIRAKEKEKKAQMKAEQAALAAKLKAEKAAQKAEKKAQMNAEAAKRRALKLAEEARIREEKRTRKEHHNREEAARKAEELRIREERKDKARKLWKERDEKRQAKRRKRREAELKEAENELKIHQEIERYRRAKRQEEDERAKLWKISKEDAARGGGLITVHDTTIKTEINKHAKIRIVDLFGIKTKEERKAKTEEERMALRMEREYRREDARAKYSFNRMLRIRTYQNSPLGRKLQKFKQKCDENKKKIITVSSAIGTVLVCAAIVVSYCTAYEYSYNGVPLGYVKNKDDVLAVTGLIKGAMSEDNNVDVLIGPEDITFDRVTYLGNVKIDTTENVLNRLTYMSDFKVASYGIYVDGNKVGALQSKDDVKKVLETLKGMYVSKADKSEVREAVFLEKVDVKECPTKLGNLLTTDEMVGKLTTDTKKETVHSAVSGETVEYIASAFGTTEEKILKDNPKLKKGKVDAGTPVLIKTDAPLVTVLIKEKIEYAEDIDYKVEKTKDKDMYEGDDKVTQKGEKGSREVTAEIVTSNGKEIQRDTLDVNVTKEPVTKKITVGTKERPPTIGDGKFSCPIHDKFHQTTGFRMRWGRFHKGVDLACPTGTKVHAADGGTVVIASYKPSYGNLVVIDHQNGYTTKYAHNSKILVNVGDKVYEGQVVALVGSTGNSTGPHCHFEVRYNNNPKNPLDFISY